MRVSEVEYISYNTGTRALPDIYALALGRCATSGVMRIYQAKHSCLCYNLYIYIYIYIYIYLTVLLDIIKDSQINVPEKLHTMATAINPIANLVIV